MRKFLFKPLLFFICLILIFPLFGEIRFNKNNTVKAYADDTFYYCRNALKTLNNSTALLYAYDMIYEGIESNKEVITVHNGVDALTEEELELVLDAYRRDHAEHFWLDNEYRFYQSETTVTKLLPTYLLTGDALTTARAEFDKAVNDLLLGANALETDYEKEKFFHDKLADKVIYSQSTHAHNAYGALVIGNAVCEGYAEALQVLLHKVKIPSLLVFGKSNNPSSGSQENHAWNMVKIDNNYYHVDLTWNDQVSTTYYAYFNVSDEIINLDHIIDETAYALPTCNSLDKNYFILNNRYLTSYTTQSIADILKQNSLVAEVFIDGNAQNFIAFVTDNIEEIAYKSGIDCEFTYGCTRLGNAVTINITISTCNYMGSTHVIAVPPTCLEPGNIEYYKCNNPDCGKYFMDNRHKIVIPNKENVIIPATGHSFSQKIEDTAHLKYAPERCTEHYIYYYDCVGCNLISDRDTYLSDKVGAHHPEKIDKVNPTCDTDGHEEYYLCECGTAFTDETALTVIEDLRTYAVIEALGHQNLTAYGTCTDCGKMVKYINKVTVLGAAGLVVIIIIISVIVKVKKNKNRKNTRGFNRL
ncbi:MAG: hypothetical protein J6B16_03015 [Clostridia bacterium]|nr:hypothetical protein [Clostridia bacterium]